MRKVSGGNYLTTLEVKDDERFGWSRDSLYRWEREGKITHVSFHGDTKSYWSLKELNSLKQPVVSVKEKAGD
jgi:hypothetical protein